MNNTSKITGIVLFLIIILLGITGIGELAIQKIANLLFSYEPNNVALASNNYINKIKFYNETYGENQILKIKFHCQTSFNIYRFATRIGWYYDGTGDKDWQTYAGLCDNIGEDIEPKKTFTAGQDYEFFIGGENSCKISQIAKYKPEQNPYAILALQAQYPNGSTALWTDLEHYLMETKPSIEINYPINNAEIENKFLLSGYVTQPSPEIYNKVMSIFYWYDENNPDNVYDNIISYVDDINLGEELNGYFGRYVNYLPDSKEQWIGIRFIVFNNETYENYHIIPDLKIKTIGEIGLPELDPEGKWYDYIDIAQPNMSTDGYYRIADQGEITFRYLFPRNWQVEITQGDQTKLAKTQFKDIPNEKYPFFSVSGFNASSTPSWIVVDVYDTNDNHAIGTMFHIVEIGTESLGLPYQGDTWIEKTLRNIFLISDETKQAYLNLSEKLKTKIPLCYFIQAKEIIDELQEPEAEVIPPLEINIQDKDGDIKTTIEMDLFNMEIIENNGLINSFLSLQRVVLWTLYFYWLISLYNIGKNTLNPQSKTEN